MMQAITISITKRQKKTPTKNRTDAVAHAQFRSCSYGKTNCCINTEKDTGKM